MQEIARVRPCQERVATITYEGKVMHFPAVCVHQASPNLLTGGALTSAVSNYLTVKAVIAEVHEYNHLHSFLGLPQWLQEDIDEPLRVEVKPPRLRRLEDVEPPLLDNVEVLRRTDELSSL